MKRLEYLINDVRLATDNTNTNGVKDREIIEYFNDAVKYIQLLIFKNQPLCTFFLKQYVYSPVTPDAEYDLPADCYADNGISTVEGRFGQTTINEGYRPLKRVWQEDRYNFFGYLTRNKKLIITGEEINLAIEAVRLHYFYRLPRFDKRWGTITNKVGNVLTIISTDPDLALINDIVSVVDSNGVVIQANIKTNSINSTTINCSTALLPEVANGMFIVSGGYSTTNLELPDEIETYLKDYVKQRIFTRNNYTDASKQIYFTEEQKTAIIDLFSNNTKELIHPPITDVDFLEI